MAVIASRMSADMDSGFVVFLIGMRINKPWKVHKWLPVFLGMPKMLKELEASPDSGFLGHASAGLTIMQYWQSFEQLEAYARGKDKSHWPAWLAFNRRMAKSRGDVGIWHETYVVQPGQYEAIYSGMPAYGLGKAGRLIPATGNREDARARLMAAGT